MSDPSKAYEGELEIVKNDFFDVRTLFAARQKQIINCYPEIYGEWECNLGNNHAPVEGTSCTSWTYWITIEQNCTGGSGGTGGTGSGSGTSDNNGNPTDGGGSGSSSNNNPWEDNNEITPTSPMIPEDDENYVFDEQVFIDEDFKNEPCLKSVYDKIGKATKFQEYLQQFESDASIADLRFTADDNFGTNRETKYHNAMAITDPPLSSNEIKITFNIDTNTSGDITEKPDVFKAVAMIHELLHAEMYRKMLDAVKEAEISGNNLNWANWTSEQFYNDFLNSLENKYFGIFDYFTRYNYGTPVGNEPNDWQHEQMAQHYRDVIKQALTDYDPTLTNAQKEALSWIGLNEANIKAWQNLTQPERDTINNTITLIKNTFPNGC